MKLNLKDLNELHDKDKLIGIFDVENDAYHAGPGISSTNLIDIQTYSEAHFKYWRENPEDPSKAMREGSLFHALLLEPQDFDKMYAVTPTLDKRTKEGKQAFEEFTQKNDGKILISKAEYDKAKEMRDSVLNTDTAKAIFKDSIFEKAIYWRDKDTDILCKCKPDIINPNLMLIADPKKTSSCQTWNIRNSIKDYKYYIQSAFHLEGVQTIYPNITDIVYIFIEDSKPYGVKFITITLNDLKEGKLKFKESLERFNKAMTTGIFPGYSQEIEQIIVFQEEKVS